jgi:hypothetical protein
MATSGSATFNLDLTEIVEEAYERTGSELRTGYDMRTARRSLNLLFADWANRGVNMWTFEQGSITLVSGLPTYPVPLDTVDLLEHVIRTGEGSVSTQADLTITRISVSTYATIPNKLQQARPIQLWFQRLDGSTTASITTLSATITATATTLTVASAANLASAGYILIGTETIYYGYATGNILSNCVRAQNGTTAAAHTAGDAVYTQNLPSVTVWPTPDDSQTYTLVYWRMRRIDDAGNGVNTMDVPFRFLNCLVAGLAYYLALKVPNAIQRLDVLKSQYDEAWELAATEDRETAALRFVPRQSYI